MARVITDIEIGQLLTESKPLPHNWESRLRPRDKSDQCFKQREIDIVATSGHLFRVVLRQNTLNPQDFSIILVFVDEDGTGYRLIRFNGRHPSDHTNKLERAKREGMQRFRSQFHIHRASERYQIAGFEMDGYADPTTVYDSFDAALKQFIALFGFVIAEAGDSEQMSLFKRQEGTEP